jgi:3-deoxy-7-phosphoheptulonate synthase
MQTEWNKSSWRNFPRVQMPTYGDQSELSQVETRLANYPPLVFAGEAIRLKGQLAEVAFGNAFFASGW